MEINWLFYSRRWGKSAVDQLWRLLVASADPNLGALRREAGAEEKARARQLGGSQNGSAAARRS